MARKIKVLHFTSSLKMGGAEAVLCDLIHSMDSNTFEHEVLYIHDGWHRKCLQSRGIPHYQVAYGPLFLFHIIQRVKKIKPDIMHTLLWAANIAGRITGWLLHVPVVSAWHNNLDQDGMMRNVLDKYTCRLAACNIAVSQEVAASAAQKEFGSLQKVRVIANGIQTENILRINMQTRVDRAKLGLNSEHFVIGSVGRFMPVKRYDLMMQAFAILHKKYKNARLILVGMGEQENFLRAQAAEMGVQHAVIFIIGQSSYPYYPLFDCFSLSSDKEGVSIALLEAMSFGLPCVVTHAQATHAVLEKGITGYFVPAGDAQKLADIWEFFLHNESVAHKIGAAGRDHVQKNFSTERMCAEYSSVFKHVIQELK